jgi:polyisoprenoid-binding protein YceI
MKLSKFILLSILLFTNLIMAQKFIPIEEKSKINFTIKNLGINVNGSFTGLKGTCNFDSKDLKNSEINVSVNSNSVDTKNKARDKHLKNDDYFDVEKFPLITFKSTKIEATKRVNRYLVEGNMIIKGITKPIKFEMLVSEKESNIEIKTSFEINRRNFKVGGNSMVLSDTVKMDLAILFEAN